MASTATSVVNDVATTLHALAPFAWPAAGLIVLWRVARRIQRSDLSALGELLRGRDVSTTMKIAGQVLEMKIANAAVDTQNAVNRLTQEVREAAPGLASAAIRPTPLEHIHWVMADRQEAAWLLRTVPDARILTIIRDEETLWRSLASIDHADRTLVVLPAGDSYWELIAYQVHDRWPEAAIVFFDSYGAIIPAERLANVGALGVVGTIVGVENLLLTRGLSLYP